MPQTVLIVEDDQSAARVLTSLCSELGLSVRHTRSGPEAVTACAQAAAAGTPFSAVILDLVLAEGDGFQFAQAARREPWGKTLPLLVVSGIYKQLPQDFADKAKPAAFFAKPFEPKAMREALTKLTGAVAGPKVLEGQVAQKPVAALFLELLRGKETGTLTVQHEGTKRVITFQQGLVRFAQSDVPAELVGAGQVASGALKQTSFDRAVALSRQQGTPLHEALMTARVMSPEQIRTALRQSMSEVCGGAFLLRAGTFRFEPRPVEAVGNVPDLRTGPVVLVLEAARRGQPALARRWLEEQGESRLSRAAELDRELFALKSTWPGESVTPLASLGRTVREVLPRVKEAELPLLQFLCLSGLITLTAPVKAEPGVLEAPAAAEEAEDRRRTFSPAAVAARKLLADERERVKNASHYDVLGLGPDASVDEVKKAYIAAAKRFHSDAFAGLELGSMRRVAEALFARIGEAHTVLSDKDKRADYDVYLDRKAKGLPTDVSAILRAEGLFQKGEIQLKQGKWEEAEASFREAIGLNHAEAEFHAYLGMAIFRRTGKPGPAKAHLAKALELEPRLKSGALFSAQLAEAEGDDDGARQLLRAALEEDPEFDEARDALRRLKQKAAQPNKGGGLLSRLLSKK